MQTKLITSVDAKQHGASSRERYRMSHGWVTVCIKRATSNKNVEANTSPVLLQVTAYR